MVQRVHGGIITDQMLTGSLRFFEIDGGAANTEFADAIGDGNQRAHYATVVSGGTGFIVGDVGSNLTVTGGTGTAAQFEILTVADGEVKSVKIDPANDGDYSAVPANPVATTGGTGSGATLNVEYTSQIIVPGFTTADGSDLYVGVNAPVPGSAAEAVIEVISEKANIVQIALVSDAVIQVAVENTGFGWVVSDDDLRDAIRALGAAVAVPDATDTGTTVDLTGATVTEKFFSAGLA